MITWLYVNLSLSISLIATFYAMQVLGASLASEYFRTYIPVHWYLFINCKENKEVVFHPDLGIGTNIYRVQSLFCGENAMAMGR